MRVLTIVLALISCNLFASSDWIHHWITAEESIENNNLNIAEENFSSAIQIMEASNDVDHPYVYLGRAELNFRDGKLTSALEDLNKALNSQELTNSERYTATLMRITIKSHMGDMEADDKDVKYVIESSETKIDQTKDMIIIRNLPNCSSLREKLPCLFIHSGMCEKYSDIKIINSKTCVIKKRCNCNVQEQQESSIHCDYCGAIFARHQEPKIEQRTIDGCKGWCDVHAVNGQLWCNKAFKHPHCNALCILAVFNLQKGCHWCCSEGAFYDKCVAPFADILSNIPSRCEPDWD